MFNNLFIIINFYQKVQSNTVTHTATPIVTGYWYIRNVLFYTNKKGKKYVTLCFVRLTLPLICIYFICIFVKKAKIMPICDCTNL